ncbi:Peroxisome assembly protein 26 [Liparis tanakae]|uniref:Peroxisome assembly protein 26 n=1 Tax=Liparis tanakae TaxID=230148 RepID=A0A4Z2HEG3_9TELE|nr:Peroxisome assembly protein 26 [Liparis tanakae]
MSHCSNSLAPARSFGPVCSPLQTTSSLTQMFSMLDTAAEQMMVHKDFRAAFETCDTGLESCANMEQEDSRCGDVKAGFCILGIQALAELNQWHGVFSWVHQQYEYQEEIPAKIMQMCILLYSKVGEPAAMQEAARVWLHCPSNSRAAGFRTVAELYLLHVLVPLGHRDEAVDLIAGSVMRKLEAMLRFLYRKALMVGSGSFPLRRVFLAAVLLYMLSLRMDPALPSSFMWISKLLKLLRQMWTAMFAPYYQALTQKQ